MGFFASSKAKVAPASKEPESIMLYAGDDLMTRAEKIVHLLGYRGAVGGFVLEVYRMLQTYERLDREAAAGKSK